MYMECYAVLAVVIDMEDAVKTNKNDNRYDNLTELGMRPVSQVFNQIRYGSALDDPNEEKWDYMSHYTRTERREMGIGGSTPAFNAKPIIAALLIVLLLVGVGTGTWLAWPYLSEKLSGDNSAAAQMEVVTGYMVHLGARDLGVIQDKAAMESFVSSWLAEQNAASQEGITYVIAQSITYDEVLIDAPYCATLQDVQNAFVKHATLDVAQ